MIYFTTKCLVQRVASDSLIERDLISVQALWTPQKVRIKETILYKLRNKKD